MQLVDCRHLCKQLRRGNSEAFMFLMLFPGQKMMFGCRHFGNSNVSGS